MYLYVYMEGNSECRFDYCAFTLFKISFVGAQMVIACSLSLAPPFVLTNHSLVSS